jgi:hypothetical protein
VSPLFQDMVYCMQIQVLDIKKSRSILDHGLSSRCSGISILGQLWEIETGGDHCSNQRIPGGKCFSQIKSQTRLMGRTAKTVIP